MKRKNKIDCDELERFYNYRDPEYTVTITPNLLSSYLEIEVCYKFRPVMTRYRISYVALEQVHDKYTLIELCIAQCYADIKNEINKPLNGLQKIKMRLENGAS